MFFMAKMVVEKQIYLEAISIFSKGRGIRKDKIFNFIKKNEEFFF